MFGKSIDNTNCHLYQYIIWVQGNGLQKLEFNGNYMFNLVITGPSHTDIKRPIWPQLKMTINFPCTFEFMHILRLHVKMWEKCWQKLWTISSGHIGFWKIGAVFWLNPFILQTYALFLRRVERLEQRFFQGWILPCPARLQQRTALSFSTSFLAPSSLLKSPQNSSWWGCRTGSLSPKTINYGVSIGYNNDTFAVRTVHVIIVLVEYEFIMINLWFSNGGEIFVFFPKDSCCHGVFNVGNSFGGCRRGPSALPSWLSRRPDLFEIGHNVVSPVM